MITRQTVLVLGAGASTHLGFPLGQKLIQDVYRLVYNKSAGIKTFRNSAEERFINDNHFKNSELLARFLELSQLKKENGQVYTCQDIEEFAKRLYEAQSPSIDFFLEKNPQYRLLGKLCIIFCISRFEDENAWQYCPSGSPDKLKIDFPDFGWYQYLWHRLLDGCQTANDLRRNKITIITFNYDRSLKHYLMRTIRSFFNVSEEEAMEVFNSIRIKHVYGRLGQFYQEVNGLHDSPLSPEEIMLETAVYRPWELSVFYRLMGNIGEYGMVPTDFEGTMLSEKTRNFLVKKFNKVAQEVQAFYDGVTEEKKKEFQSDLVAAERIYFLGFGYHDENIKALGFQENGSGLDLRKVQIKGTAVNLTQEEVHGVRKRLVRIFKANDIHEADNVDVRCSWEGMGKSEICLITSFLRTVAPLV